MLKSIFLSPNEPRLRAGWRLLVQTILLFSITFLIAIPITLVFIFLQNQPENILSTILTNADLLISQVALLFAITASVFLARRLLDRRTINSLGLRLNILALKDIFAGLVITFLQFALIYGLMSALGWVTFESFSWQNEMLVSVIGNTLLTFIFFTLVSWNEELLSRGYHLQTIASGTNLPTGILISSALFGVLHMGNPHATWISTSGIVLAGFFLAFSYVRTRQLWLPMGLHLGWNFFEGTVFGFPVSGLEVYSLSEITINGPSLWTGGQFGPESGLILLPGLLFGTLLIILYTQKRKQPDNFEKTGQEQGN